MTDPNVELLGAHNWSFRDGQAVPHGDLLQP
jgi:hypothetical protein